LTEEARNHLMLELGRLETSLEINRLPVDLAERAISSLASQAL